VAWKFGPIQGIPGLPRKGRVTKAPHRARSAPPAFVELIAPRPGSFPECWVELEGPRGRMRMQFKGMATAELWR
jgi:hypothetical protein